MAPHATLLAWKIPWTEEPGRLQSVGSKESDTTERLTHHRLICVCVYVYNLVSDQRLSWDLKVSP